MIMKCVNFKSILFPSAIRVLNDFWYFSSSKNEHNIPRQKKTFEDIFYDFFTIEIIKNVREKPTFFINIYRNKFVIVAKIQQT